jgi:hypothetical protein
MGVGPRTRRHNAAPAVDVARIQRLDKTVGWTRPAVLYQGAADILRLHFHNCR